MKTAAAEAITAQPKKTVRGQIISIRSFKYGPDLDKDAGEVVLRLADGETLSVVLFHEAIGFVDGWWINATATEYVTGPKLANGQWVQAHGLYSEKIWDSKKFGEVIQKRIAISNPMDLQLITLPKRPGMVEAQAQAEPKRPKRPAAI